MSSTFSLSKLCTNFFTPPAQHVPSDPKLAQLKKNIDHISGYLLTSNGAWDFFRVVAYVASFFKSLPSLDSGHREFAHKVSGVMDRAGIALSMPKTIADAYNLRNSIAHLSHVQNTSPLDPERDKIIAHAYKKILVDGMNLVNTGSQAVLFLKEVSLLNLGKQACAKADVIYNLSSIVNDTIEFFDESAKLHHFHSQAGHTQREKVILDEKKNLSWMKIAKDVPSIIGSVLAISAIFFTILQVPVVSTISLGFSIAWLTMKLTSTLYEKIITEKHSRQMAFV